MRLAHDIFRVRVRGFQVAAIEQLIKRGPSDNCRAHAVSGECMDIEV